jgi:hypothetical protein
MQWWNTSVIHLSELCFLPFPPAKRANNYSFCSQLLPISIPGHAVTVANATITERQRGLHCLTGRQLYIRTHLNDTLPGRWIGSSFDSPLFPGLHGHLT